MLARLSLFASSSAGSSRFAQRVRALLLDAILLGKRHADRLG